MGHCRVYKMNSENDFIKFPFDKEILLEELQEYMQFELLNDISSVDKIIYDTQKLDIIIDEFIQGLTELNKTSSIIDTNNLDIKRFILRHIFNFLNIPAHYITYSLEQMTAVKEIIQKYNFTSRESEVLKLISYNIPLKEIANILDCSELTINKHLQNMLIKIQNINYECDKNDEEKLKNPLKTIKKMISL